MSWFFFCDCFQVALRRAPNYTFGVKNQFSNIIAYSPGPSDYKKEEYNHLNRFPAFRYRYPTKSINN